MAWDRERVSELSVCPDDFCTTNSSGGVCHLPRALFYPESLFLSLTFGGGGVSATEHMEVEDRMTWILPPCGARAHTEVIGPGGWRVCYLLSHLPGPLSKNYYLCCVYVYVCVVYGGQSWGHMLHDWHSSVQSLVPTLKNSKIKLPRFQILKHCGFNSV